MMRCRLTACLLLYLGTAATLGAQDRSAPERMREMQGELRVQRERLRELRATRPADAGIAVALAATLMASGDPNAALALHDTLLAAARPDTAVFRYIGEFWIHVGDADSAAVHLQRGVGLYDAQSDLWALLGWAQAMRGANASASDAYLRAAKLERGRPWHLLRAATAAQAVGDSVRARARLAEIQSERQPPQLASMIAALEAGDDARGAVEAPRDSAQHRRLLREGIARLADHEAQVTAPPTAISAAALHEGRDLIATHEQRQLQHSRDEVGTLLQLAIATPWGGEELKRLRRAYPGSAMVRRFEVEYALSTADTAVALRDAERLLRQQPSDPTHHVLYAKALELAGHRQQAIATYARAMELAPSRRELFAALLRLHREAGTTDSLLSQLRRLRQLRPEHAALLEYERELLHRLGHLEAAHALEPMP